MLRRTSENPVRGWALAALIFGAMTVFSGARALFGGASAQASLGQVVDFVLWFNFLAGFAYLLAGGLIWRQSRWARWVAGALVLGTALVGVGLGVHMAGGGAYEVRTVVAMALRLGFWTLLARVLWRGPNFIK